MKSPFFVSEFKSNNFALNTLIKHCINSNFQDVNQKKQLKFIIEHLVKLDAKTIVCESEYIDNGYLADYTRYYVGCHEEYSKKCSRLHFFTGEFDYAQFETVVEIPGHDPETSLGKYLGYIVIKPIPMTFIGRTCLATSYHDDHNTKIINKEYKVDLFSLQLTVESLAFQEQDQVVSACASTALWTIFHGIPNIKVPSPSEITLAATEHNKIINSFPNDGLTSDEIDRVIEYYGFRKHNLNPKAYNEKSKDIFNLCVKSNIDSDIPVFLGVSVYECQNNSNFEFSGEHAVAIVGYSQDENGEIESLFVHDDRKGPFTRVTIIENDESILSGGEQPKFYFKNIKIGNEEDSEEIFVLNNLLVVTDERVRINYRLIQKSCDDLIEFMNKSFFKMIVKDFEKLGIDIDYQGEFNKAKLKYSIRLLKSSTFKSEVKKNNLVKNKLEVLTRNFPKFIWVAELKSFNNVVLELVFDASSLPQGEAFMCSVEYDDTVNQMLNSQSEEMYKKLLQVRGDYISRDNGFILQILRHYINDANSYFKYLDEKFGPARPPKRIKQEEFGDQLLNQQSRKLVLLNSTDNPERLINIFDEQQVIENSRKLIWVISHFGALLIGEDATANGHPTLTGANPARIGGELILEQGSKLIQVNCYSGRYSTNYVAENKEHYLLNAIEKMRDVFRNQIADGWSFDMAVGIEFQR